MFNLSGSEIVVILLLALVVLGPEKLPDALRRAGKTYAELKKMGNSFQSEMKSVLDEPMKEMRDTADLLKKSMDFTDGELTTSTTTPSRVTLAPQQATAQQVASHEIAAAPTPDVAAATDTDAGATTAADGAAATTDDVAAAGPVVEDQPVRNAEDELINRTLSGEQ